MYRVLFSLFLATLVACTPQPKQTQTEAAPLMDAAAATSQPSAGKSDDAKLLEVKVTDASLRQQLLYRTGYVCNYNSELRIPNYCAWYLTRSHTYGHEKRGGIEFQEDTDVPTPRADTYDYIQSGYDRGHMCPAGDNKWSHRAIAQTFLLSNVCPQNHDLNAGDWNDIEQMCREWARREGKIYLVAGPIFYGSKPRRIGKHKVAVPDAFFKVVLSTKGTPKAIGFVCYNKGGHRKTAAYVKTLAEVERLTGYRFFSSLPASTRKRIENHASLADW